MTGFEYQKLAMRTNDGSSEVRLIRELMSSNTPCRNLHGYIADLLMGVLGLTGEAGEVADLVKKGIFHEKGIDKNHLQRELCDVMWYITMICHACGFNMDDIMELNIEKLKARYPEGFDTYKANHRKNGDI